jgi:hypothetical protein
MWARRVCARLAAEYRADPTVSTAEVAFLHPDVRARAH